MSLLSLMESKYNEADSALVNALRRLAQGQKKRRALIKASTYKAPAAPEIEVESWKMDEFKYYDIPSPFPTFARGLFTTKLDGTMGDGDKRYRIVARGYDKFFNIGEVPWTTWDSLRKETKAPYILTLKSNGCVIFIASLSPNKLLVCSKHSIGPNQSAEHSHAVVGERWLEKHLASVGKTKEDLAKKLWENNWTAVAELCDDEFEEHVLPYTRDNSGLHLHGINESTGLFKTQPLSVVDTFAREWGFIVTLSTTLDSVDEVKSFTEEIGRTGSWNGEPLEGFVVRTTVADPPTGPDGDKRHSPYAPDSSFFFKIKFDEPYMMYRDWREVTKTLLSAKGDLDDVSLPKSKMQRVETKAYTKWVKEEIKRDREQFDGYMKNHGIIRTRERFLEWMMSQAGKDATKVNKKDTTNTAPEKTAFGKTIIVPIAVPGVGKTVIAVALSKLFGFGHTQSDDVKVKKSAPLFIKNVVGLLKTHDVVIADKNNHLRQHRQQLRDAVNSFEPPVRLLALVWSFEERPRATTHRICADRVLARGTNHQSLHGDAAAKAHEDVIWQFLQSAEELGENEVDDTIEMDVGEDLEDALDRAVDGVTRALNLQKPDREAVGAALAAARGYAPASVDAKPVKATTPRYYGLLPELDLHAVLAPLLDSDSAPPAMRELWKELNEKKRVAERPHITLTHQKSRDVQRELWDRCVALHLTAIPPMFRARLVCVLSDGRAMALAVQDLSVDADEGQVGSEFVSTLPADVRERLHVTVGTRDADVPPVEAKVLVERWNRGERDGIECVEVHETWVRGRVKGLVS